MRFIWNAAPVLGFPLQDRHGHTEVSLANDEQNVKMKLFLNNAMCVGGGT